MPSYGQRQVGRGQCHAYELQSSYLWSSLQKGHRSEPGDFTFVSHKSAALATRLRTEGLSNLPNLPYMNYLVSVKCSNLAEMAKTPGALFLKPMLYGGVK